MSSHHPPRLAVLISFSGDGGVERMVLNLLQEFGRSLPGQVDLVTLKVGGGHLQTIPEGVRHVPLGVRHASLAVPALVRYLRRCRPEAMLAAKDRAGRAALLAQRVSGVPVRIVVRLGNTLSESLAGAPLPKRWSRYLPIRWLYPWADAIIAVSEGVAEDVVATSGVDAGRVTVIRNPVITERLPLQAAEPVEHPWLQRERDQPTVLAMGRLTRQKDFPTLLQAFAYLQVRLPSRLVVLGEGRDRHRLEQQAQELGLTERVHLAGFQTNPYAWLARADLFVLSSAWEGSPNALTEALALGIPAVSTDCRSGPREVLAGGRYGLLVPVGDAAALARAMESTLREPHPGWHLRQAIAEYRSEASARRYLEVLGIA